MTSYRLIPGSAPLLISLPHVGTHIPVEGRDAYRPRALASEDTDWHLEAVYAPIAQALGASLLVPEASRYWIDLNRPADNAPMYPGANNTELCPTRFFDGTPIYQDGRAPDAAEQARRVDSHWRPYHQALAAELARLKARHGHALLWDGHSIESELPWLFEGRLPDLNLGTASGASCTPAVREALGAVLAAQTRYTQVVDGRFKGGHITRHYGRPHEGVQAIQMEMVQAIYMLEDKAHPTPRPLVPQKVDVLRPLLQQLLQTYLETASR
ncbi:N-formylglutamate deformylase [Inhella crocodyli]|uniref:N-formylglutamate deformylase n=1 Tax=Inhella crocodyli TaxID=2499851 RepID=A0A3S2UHV3_9BURK|nr:N-formylglutamate deformylase [Inhella crocodyli]RVT88450.1 N-formylglutamate deformylase [Inhella crocodyli]